MGARAVGPPVRAPAPEGLTEPARAQARARAGLGGARAGAWGGGGRRDRFSSAPRALFGCRQPGAGRVTGRIRTLTPLSGEIRRVTLRQPDSSATIASAKEAVDDAVVGLGLPGVSWTALKAVSWAACLVARCFWSASSCVLCPWGGVGSSVIVCWARPGWRYPGWSCFLWWWTIWWALPFLEGRARRLPPGRPPSAPRSFPPRGMFRISRGARRSWAEMYRGAATRKVPQGAGPQDLTTSATVRSPHPQHQGRPATRAHHCTSMPTQSDPPSSLKNSTLSTTVRKTPSTSQEEPGRRARVLRPHPVVDDA